MKKFLALLIASFVVSGAFAQHKIEVVVKQITEPKGMIAVALFSNATDFLKKPVASMEVKAEKGEVRLIFENIPSGNYAVSVIHDANGNGELDKNFIGIPKEGFGFSNDAMGKFGPPSFSDARFSLGNENAPLILNLIYY